MSEEIGKNKLVDWPGFGAKLAPNWSEKMKDFIYSEVEWSHPSGFGQIYHLACQRLHLRCCDIS